MKTVRFQRPVYVGDPINTVKIFNEKEVDEIVVLDILASRSQRTPDFSLIAEIAGECFMPMAYGGGLTTIEQIRSVFNSGVEKVVLNTSAVYQPDLIRAAADQFGSQSVVVSIDAKRRLLGGYSTMTHGATQKTRLTPAQATDRAVDNGAGEILINSIDRDGTFTGYDLELIRQVTSRTTVPVIACGGAAKVQDFVEAVMSADAAAVAAGSMFVFHGPHRAVLVNFPDEATLQDAFFSRCR